MTPPFFSRREFARQVSTATTGLIAAPGLLRAATDPSPGSAPAGKQLVLLGLNALARAHEMNYFADGHRGASMVSAHLLCVDNEMSKPARERIEQLFDLNWGSSKLCEPFPESDAKLGDIRRIGLALAENGPTLRQVGHDAIFAMLAIKGFRMMPEAATPERIDGVCKLVKAMTPWRDVDPDPEVQPPPFSDAKASARFILKEASASVERFSGFGQGFAGHMLTFGQALVEMAAMGDEEWAESCRTAFRKYVTVTRMGPAQDDRKIKDHQPSKLRPNEAEYWSNRGDKSLGIGHVFKYPYSYYELLELADAPEIEREWESKAWQIF